MASPASQAASATRRAAASASASEPSHLSLDWASEHGTPVFLTLWDFSPPGLTATLGMRLGLGIWHSQLWLPDMNIELAFGGHDEDDLTGIFTLPREPYSFASPFASLPCVHCMQSPPQPLIDGISHALPQPELVPAPGPSALPAARYVGCWFLGYAGAPEDESGANSEGRPSKTGRWAAPQTGRLAFRELLFPPSSTSTSAPAAPNTKPSTWASFFFPDAGSAATTTPAGTEANRNTYSSQQDRSDAADARHAVGRGRPLVLEVGRKHPRHSGARARSIAFVMRTVKELKDDPEWYGKRYDLLSHNCNHFTAVLLQRLTGAKLPSWINRTAGLGRTFAEYLPASFFELATDAPGEEALVEGAEYGADAHGGSEGKGAGTAEEKEKEREARVEAQSMVARVREELHAAEDKAH